MKANGTVLTPSEDGVYTISHVAEDQAVTVEGVVSQDTPVIYEVSFSGEGWSIVPVDGENLTVPEGEDFRFRVQFDNIYEASSSFAVRVDDPTAGTNAGAGTRVITPDEDGIYTIENVQRDTTVYTFGVTRRTFTVTLSAGTGYTLSFASGYSASVLGGDSTRVKITFKEGYQKGENFAVKANGTALELVDGTSDTYEIPNVREAKTVTVEGVESITLPVTLTEGEGYYIAPSKYNSDTNLVSYGRSYSFAVVPRVGYKKGSDFAVKVNGTKVSPSAGTEGLYFTISNIKEAKTVTVEGIVEDPIKRTRSLSVVDNDCHMWPVQEVVKNTRSNIYRFLELPENAAVVQVVLPEPMDFVIRENTNSDKFDFEGPRNIVNLKNGNTIFQMNESLIGVDLPVRAEDIQGTSMNRQEFKYTMGVDLVDLGYSEDATVTALMVNGAIYAEER